MGKIMYKGQEFQGKIERVEPGGGIVYEEDRDYEWDFTRSEHPELDINYGEPIWLMHPNDAIFSSNGIQIGYQERNIYMNALSVPLGNTKLQYWPYPTVITGKTIEIDVVELLALRKPTIPTGSSRTYHRMFMYNGVSSLTRNAAGGYGLVRGFSSDSGLIYTQKSTPQESGWCTYDSNAGSWSSTLTPETVAYDSIDYFDGKTLKFEFTSIPEGAYSKYCYLYRIYVDDVLLATKSYYNSDHSYLHYFVINPYGSTSLSNNTNGMQGTIISGIRVYKNQWYEPKFQPEQQGGD